MDQDLHGLAVLLQGQCLTGAPYRRVSFRAPFSSGIRLSMPSRSPWLWARAAATSALSSSCRAGCLASSYRVHSRVMEVWRHSGVRAPVLVVRDSPCALGVC